jgi:RecA/RadA recombinase
MKASTLRFETGLNSLDKLLGGGFESGSLNLIYGEATSGKTTLALTIAFHHLDIKRAAKCVYIDSDNKLRMERVINMADYKASANLNRFNLFIPDTFKKQKETLEHLPELGPYDLLIVDSVTSLYRTETGDEEKTYMLNRELNHHMGYIAELAITKGACFILTGQVRSILDFNQVEPVAPRLLSYWNNVIIKLEKTPFSSTRNVILEKPKRPGNVILVNITDEGMKEAIR